MFRRIRRHLAARRANAPTPRRRAADWRTRLQDPSLTAEEFTRIVAEMESECIEGMEVRIIGLLRLETRLANGVESSSNLENLWSNCRDFPDERLQRCEQWIGTLRDLGSDGPPRDNGLVPVIKSEAWVRAAREKMPLQAEHLAADIWVLYAIDRPHSLEFQTEEQLRETPEPRREAEENLKRVLPPVERHGDGSDYFMLVAGGDFEASLLLFDDLWEDMAQDVDGDLVAAVPARDVLIFTGSKNTAALTRMRSVVDELFAADAAYLISSRLLVRRGGRWKESSDEDLRA